MAHVWRLDKSTLDSGTERWLIFSDAGSELPFGKVVEQWRNSESFRAFWNASLGEVPFGSYCWECPPVTSRTMSRAFECVFVSSPLLARLPPDPEPFAEYFQSDAGVVTFESLGKDALLVAPAPGPRGTNYSHLASFVATAPEAQKSELWKTVGTAFEQRVGANPTWLSTAGLGVAWLHVRLDSRPKYYRHDPYRKV